MLMLLVSSWSLAIFQLPLSFHCQERWTLFLTVLPHANLDLRRITWRVLKLSLILYSSFLLMSNEDEVRLGEAGGSIGTRMLVRDWGHGFFLLLRKIPLPHCSLPASPKLLEMENEKVQVVNARHGPESRPRSTTVRTTKGKRGVAGSVSRRGKEVAGESHMANFFF